MIGKWVLVSLLCCFYFFIIYTRSSINVISFLLLSIVLRTSNLSKWNASHTFPPSMPHFSQDFTYLKASALSLTAHSLYLWGLLNTRSSLLSKGGNLAKRQFVDSTDLRFEVSPYAIAGVHFHICQISPVSWRLIQKDVVLRKRGMWQPVFHFQLIHFFSKRRGE